MSPYVGRVRCLANALLTLFIFVALATEMDGATVPTTESTNIASQCAALVEAKSKIADDPWPLMPPGGEEALMAKMPKTVSSEQVRQVVKVYMGEMKKKLDKQIDKCNYDPQSICYDMSELEAQIESDPSTLLPLAVEDALMEEMPKEVTPGLMGIMARPFLLRTQERITPIVQQCQAGGEQQCRKFLVDHGNVEFDAFVSKATVTCDGGYKARVGDGSDLTDAGRSRTITCDPNDHTWKPAPANCYGWLIDGCEIGWDTLDTLTSCYRVLQLKTNGTVDDANRVCLNHGGALASAKDDKEFQFLVFLAGNKKESPLLGLQRAPNEGWEKAKWVDGSAGGFTKWLPGEPIVRNGAGRGCVQLGQQNGVAGMQTVSCEAKSVARFICKRVPTKIASK